MRTPLRAEWLRRDGSRAPCRLHARAHALCELTAAPLSAAAANADDDDDAAYGGASVLQRYRYVDFDALGALSDAPGALTVHAGGRARCFVLAEPAKLAALVARIGDVSRPSSGSRSAVTRQISRGRISSHMRRASNTRLNARVAAAAEPRAPPLSRARRLSLARARSSRGERAPRGRRMLHAL